NSPPCLGGVAAASADGVVVLSEPGAVATRLVLSEPGTVVTGFLLSEPRAVATRLVLSEPGTVVTGFLLSEPGTVATGFPSIKIRKSKINLAPNLKLIYHF